VTAGAAWQPAGIRGILKLCRRWWSAAERIGLDFAAFSRPEVYTVVEILAIRYVSRLSIRVGHGFGFAGLLALLGAVPCAADSSYGFVRTVEGDADLLSGSSQPAIQASANYPIQVGDQVRVAQGGRMEVVLPDRSLLRLDGNSELKFGRLAWAIDTNDDQNLLQLLQGQIQIAVPTDPTDNRAFRIDTANSSLFLLSSGSYRIFTDGKSWTQAIVRTGFAEVTTDRGTTRLGTGQQALIDGDRSPRVIIQAAPPPDSLEQWADRLDADANAIEAQVPSRSGHISPTLSYAAAPLHRHGRWTRYRGSQVWRPRVSSGWRPYHSGWWIYTPTGLTWVSTEPWGWVTYHYGVWGHAGDLGWVWYPGQRYTPGAVYWYWGPTHVGWIPAGFYSPYSDYHYYAMPPYGYFGAWHGLASHRYPVPHANRRGFQSRMGGDVSNWHDWTFSTYERFGYRDSHRFLKTGAELERLGVFQTEIPKGVITTETRGLTPNLWREPRRILATLESPHSSRPRASGLGRLGAAAMARTPTRPGRADNRFDTRGSQPGRLVRQWDPDLWRRDNLTRPQPISPYRRDTRSASSYSRGSQGSPTVRRTWGDHQTPGLSGPSGRGTSSLSRPVLPGPGRRAIGRSRSPTATPRSGRGMGKATARGRSSTRASGRVSGSGGGGSG